MTRRVLSAHRIVALDDAGEWETLQVYASYYDADYYLDYWCNKFPHSHIEILPC